MKKGFTLVELIGVIVILGLIAAFSVPALTKTFKKTADKEYEEFVKNITLAAENYFHSELNSQINTKTFITVEELFNHGYLKKTVNPLTNTDVRDDATVIITKKADNSLNIEFVNQNLTTDGYVQENLILLYDGYTDIENNSILDLSNNNHNGTITGVTHENNYYSINELNNKILTNLNLTGTSLTMEICFEYIDGSYILKTDAGTISRLYENKLFKGDAPSFIEANNINVRTIKYYVNNENNYAKGYINGTLVDEETVTDLLNGTYISIGDGAKLKVYSVRIYSHELTDNEIKQNYTVDKYRFGIGA